MDLIKISCQFKTDYNPQNIFVKLIVRWAQWSSCLDRLECI